MELKMLNKKNKKGQFTIFLFVGLAFVVGVLFLIIILGSFATHFGSTLNKNITIGKVNLATLNGETLGKFSTMVLAHADWWGLALIFGMTGAMFLGAYFTRNRSPRFGMILDIFIIIVAFFVGLYIANIYSTLVPALSSAGETFAQTSLTKTSFFILHLHIFVAIIGAIMMILFHSGIPAKPEEAQFVNNAVVST